MRLWGLIGRALPEGERRHHLLVMVALLFSLVQFLPANLAQFSYDDYKLIVENPTIRSFDGVGAVLSSGRPLRGLSYMLDYALFGLDPRGYHLVNIGWHFAACVLFYLLAWRLFGSIRVAGLAVLLFAWHPIHAEAVMGIAHRKEMMAATFLFLSLHAYLSRRQYPRAAVPVSILFFLFGILSKQVVLVLPLILLAHEALTAEPERKRALVRLWPWLLIPVVLLAAGAAIAGPVLDDFNIFGLFSSADYRDESYFRILASSFNQYPHYLRGLLFPFHLTVVPALALKSWAQLGPWLGVASFIALGGSAFLARRDRIIAFALAWVVINLLPVMNWVPANALYADRYLYIPSAGFCLLIAALWERLYLADFAPRPIFRRFYVFAGLAMMLGAGITIMLLGQINRFWTHPELWKMDRAQAIVIAGFLGALVFAPVVMMGRTWLEKDESAPGWKTYLITYLAVSGGFILAFVLAQALIEGHFGIPDLQADAKYEALNSWISRHAKPGPRAGSSAVFQSGSAATEIMNLFLYQISLGSFFLFAMFRVETWAGKQRAGRKLAVSVLAMIMMGMVIGSFTRVNDWSSDIRLWRTAIMEDQNSLIAWNNLGKTYLDRRRFDLAIQCYQRATQIDPNQPDAWRNLGMAYLGARNLELAAMALERAIKLRPTDLASSLNLANILVVQAASGKNPDGYRQAIPHYLHILEVYPGSAHALHNLAFCYYAIGAYEQALGYVEKAIRLDPVSAKARQLRADIERAMKQAG